ncbi:MAG: hypothetical protein ACXWU6_14330, partial [Allosphingosinicella sp.]
LSLSALVVFAPDRGWTPALYYGNNTLPEEVRAMLEDPVVKRAAVAAAIGAVVAIPVPFVGPVFGAIVGAGIGFFTARRGG